MLNVKTPDFDLGLFVRYEPSDGSLRWVVRRNSCGGVSTVGGRVGRLRKDGYLDCTIDQCRLKVHRVVWFLCKGAWPTKHLDHINGNRIDNRIENLREATQAQNNQNSSKLRPNNTSGHPGVCWDRKKMKWYAQIQVDKKHRFLGYFAEKDDAVRAYAEGKKSLHPFHVPQSGLPQ